MSVGSSFLKTGHRCAVFHWSKTLPFSTLREYNLVSGGTTSGSAIRNNLGVIWSGPVALLVFTALILLDISFSEI